jgi:hypothetical protein
MLNRTTKFLACALYGLAAATALYAQDQGPEGTVPPSKPSCPKQLDEFAVGVASADDIRRCNGAPKTQDNNPDGRFTYLYELRNGIMIVYLFGQDRLLIRTRAYQNKGGQ